MRLFAFATAAILAAGPLAAQDKAYDANTVVATVNGTEITLGHMVALMERLPERYQQLDDDQLFSGILGQLVDQAMIADTVSADPASDPMRARLVIQNERWSILSNQAIDAIAATEPTEADFQAEYDRTIGMAEPKPEFRASHVLVETKEEAEAVIEMLNGGADFAQTAREKSTGPSGPQGGDLGWFAAGAMVPPFDAAVQAMEVDTISEPVETQFGWHVIQLVGKRDRPSLDDVRDDLRNAILRGRIDAALADMRSAAEISRPEHGIPASAIRENGLLDAQ